MKGLYLSVALVCLFPSWGQTEETAAVQAIPGDLDASFSGDGKVTTDLNGESLDFIEALAVQADSKIVAAGVYDYVSGGGALALARYLPNGALDTTFSSDGKVMENSFGGVGDYASALAVQPDGKIVVVGGSSIQGRDDFGVARYLANGTLDVTFAGDGNTRTNIGATEETTDSATALVLQPDGKIVATGRAGTNGRGNFALARYTANGSLDTTFSGDGKIITDFGSDSEGASALAVQSDGKIVVVGGSGGAVAVARYLRSGVLDASFSGDGKVTTDLGGSSAFAVAIQPDGKIMVAGGVLARYLPTGVLDASFGEGGIVRTVFGVAAFQQDGKIVTAGTSADGFVLTRYLPDGNLDPIFGGDGMVTTEFGGEVIRVGALVIQPKDGRLIVGGNVGFESDWPVIDDFALARYHAIQCVGFAATRVGTAGNDILNGTPSADVIIGLSGNDRISGFGGNDILCGADGNDTINAGDGNDTVGGGRGDDALIGGAGTDTCDGGPHVYGDTASSCEDGIRVP